MIKSEIAVTKFKEGYNCAQSVVFSFSEKLKISNDFALKISKVLAEAWEENRKLAKQFPVEY